MQRYLKVRQKCLSEEEGDLLFIYLFFFILNNFFFLLELLLARHYLKQIVDGMIYLHSFGILHRDLTLSNLLLTKEMNIVRNEKKKINFISRFNIF